MMPRVPSLNVSFLGDEAFEQLLGPRSAPIPLSSALDVNQAGSSDHDIATCSLQHALAAIYSEPLPLLPGHRTRQSTRSTSAQQGLPSSNLVSALSAPEYQQDQFMQHVAEGCETRPDQSQHVCNSAPGSEPLLLTRSLPTFAEPLFLLPAHSASPPSGITTDGHVHRPISSDDTPGPMRCIDSGNAVRTVSTSSVLAVGALHSSHMPKGAGSDVSTAVPFRQGLMKTNEDVLQQAHGSHDAVAPAVKQVPPVAAPPASVTDQAVFASACMQPKSPSGQLHSAGGSVGESSTMYSNGCACPYPYSMPETYGMPYGDPYYNLSYPYHPSMDGLPPHHDPDPLVSYGPAHVGHQCLDSSSSRMLHYQGYVAPRQRFYRRFISGSHGRRTCQAADGVGPEVLTSMGSDPTNYVSTSAALLTGERLVPQAAGCGTRMFGSVTSSDYVSQELVVGSSGCAGTGGISHSYPMQFVPVPRPGSSLEAELDGVKAARACHEQFLTDDVPLPLPRSTVDGIRQELRAVAQELLQRRMGEARKQQLFTSGSEYPRLPLARSWASGDQPEFCFRTAGTTASLHQDQELHANAATQEAQTPVAHFDPYSQAGTALGGHSFIMLPHKRGASSKPSSSAGASPVRSRPAPSASVGNLGKTASYRGADIPGEMSNVPASQPLSSLPLLTTAIPCGSHHLTPSVSGPVANRPALVGKCKLPGAAVNMTAPTRPRTAMSGKSAASGTQGASVAQAVPACGSQQPQQQVSATLLMGGHGAGQQGSMVAEAEDDGEEVHGPLQRCGNTRARGVVSCGTRDPCGPLQFPSGCYGTSMSLPSYDYSHGYYYPPPMTTYGMRMYGMTPPGASSAPPSYRLPMTSAPAYGMTPPVMSGAAIPAYSGPGPAPWSDYCESQGGPPGVVPSGLMHGASPACS